MSIQAASSSAIQSLPQAQSKCSVCSKTDLKMMQCSKCHFATYCSPACQKIAWPNHKKVCNVKARPEDKTLSNEIIKASAAASSTIAARSASSSSSSQGRDFWTQLEKESKVWRGDKSIHLPFLVNTTNRDEFWNQYPRKMPKSTSVPELLEHLIGQTNFDPAVKTALDLGCSSGAASIYLLERDWSVVALDRSAGILKALQQTANKMNSELIKSKKLVIECKDVSEYPFKEKVSLIVANQFFSYTNPLKFRDLWQKINESLIEGGYLVGSFCCRGQPPEFLEIIAEMGAWFLDKDLAVVKTFLLESNYTIEKCQFQYAYPSDPEPLTIQFIVQKAVKS